MWGYYYRDAARSLIYYKSLRLSAAARSIFSTGQILTLMSVDVDRLLQGTVYYSMIVDSLVIFFLFVCLASLVITWAWLGCILISAVLGLLSRLVGVYAVVAASATMLLILLAQYWIGVEVGKARRLAVHGTETRLKVINESLLGIRVVKLYGWEVSVNWSFSSCFHSCAV
jgi:hypothetical protein